MVKCANCGFLAIRNSQTRELMEVEPVIREEGRRRSILPGFRYTWGYETPVCFMNAYNLWDETGDLNKATSESIQATIQKERECKAFVTWQHGYTPKEHKEMLDRQEMLKWQAAREDADKKWQTRQQWFMVIIAGIFTVLGGIIGAVIALLSSAKLP